MALSGSPPLTVSHTGVSLLPAVNHVMPLQPAGSKGWSSFSEFEFPRSATLPAAMKAHGGKQK